MASEEDILLHYEDRYDEDVRLSSSGLGQLELIRTQILIRRHLPPPPALVLAAPRACEWCGDLTTPALCGSPCARIR